MSVVRESMSTDKVFTTKRIRHFSRRARQYDRRMDAEVDTTTHEADPISVVKLVKQFKTFSVIAISTQLSARQPMSTI
jgi:hypothetical protein